MHSTVSPPAQPKMLASCDCRMVCSTAKRHFSDCAFHIVNHVSLETSSGDSLKSSISAVSARCHAGQYSILFCRLGFVLAPRPLSFEMSQTFLDWEAVQVIWIRKPVAQLRRRKASEGFGMVQPPSDSQFVSLVFVWIFGLFAFAMLCVE